ncbi:MAG: hypothetical protein IKU96_03875, partial [Alistipes sp.]|nr:hypothetical protein [Alistipes sp.]
MMVLEGGESYALPSLHIGAVQGSLDDAVNSMHAHTRKITLPEADPTGCFVIGSVGELHHSKDVEEIKKRAREYAELGAEIFLIDAGWQCPKDR